MIDYRYGKTQSTSSPKLHTLARVASSKTAILERMARPAEAILGNGMAVSQPMFETYDGSAGQGACGGSHQPTMSARLVHRGDVRVAPVIHRQTWRIDASLNISASEEITPAQLGSVRLSHCAVEVGARVVPLQHHVIPVGGLRLVQLILDEPITAQVHDQFIIRDHGASQVIGAGHFLDLRPLEYHRCTPARLERLAAMDTPDPVIALAAGLSLPPYWLDWEAFVHDWALDTERQAALLDQVPHQAISRRNGVVLFEQEAWHRYVSQALSATSDFHRRYPQLLGTGMARIAGAFEPRLAGSVVSGLLEEIVKRGLLATEGGVYRLPSHQLGLDACDQRMWCAIRTCLGGDVRFHPPRLSMLAAATQQREFDLRRILKAMAARGNVVEIVPDFFVLSEVVREVASIILDMSTASENGRIVASTLRDRLDVGRKVAIQMLEYFDRLGVTMRSGDDRVVDRAKMAHYLNDRA